MAEFAVLPIDPKSPHRDEFDFEVILIDGDWLSVDDAFEEMEDEIYFVHAGEFQTKEEVKEYIEDCYGCYGYEYSPELEMSTIRNRAKSIEHGT